MANLYSEEERAMQLEIRRLRNIVRDLESPATIYVEIREGVLTAVSVGGNKDLNLEVEIIDRDDQRAEWVDGKPFGPANEIADRYDDLVSKQELRKLI